MKKIISVLLISIFFLGSFGVTESSARWDARHDRRPPPRDGGYHRPPPPPQHYRPAPPPRWDDRGWGHGWGGYDNYYRGHRDHGRSDLEKVAIGVGILAILSAIISSNSGGSRYYR